MREESLEASAAGRGASLGRAPFGRRRPRAPAPSLCAGKAAFKSGARRAASPLAPALGWAAAKEGRQAGRQERASERASGAARRQQRAPPPRGNLTGRRRRREDAGGRLPAREGGRAGEAERRLAAAVEEEALHPHRGGLAAHSAQAAGAGGPPWRGGGRGQDEGAALRHHEDGGLRGAQGQVRLLHGGDERGQGDRLSLPAGAGLERRDHAAAGAVQEPPGHPGRQVHPAEAAAPRPAARAPPPQRLQLRLARRPRSQDDLEKPFWKLRGPCFC